MQRADLESGEPGGERLPESGKQIVLADARASDSDDDDGVVS